VIAEPAKLAEHVTSADQGQSAAASPMAAADVADCFSLFLGRLPAPDVSELCVGADLATVVRDLIQGEEFRVNVLTPLLLREPLPQARMAPQPAPRLIDWAQRRLPLESTMRSLAGAARSWEQLLEVLLADSALVSLAPTLVAAEIDRLLRDRLEAAPLFKVRRSVIGAIDAASAVEIRGWALDLCDRQVPVMLEFYADNLFIGATTCSESRPDVQEAMGGDGLCGFTFAIPTARRASFGAGRELIAIDAVGRQRIAAGIVVRADLTSGLDLLSATRRDVAQLRDMLQRIEARLPDLGRLASVPLDAYDEYWHRFYRLAPDTLARQREDAGTFARRPLISIVLPTWNADLTLLDLAIDSVRAQSYDRWELIVCDDASGSDALRLLMQRHELDSRFRWIVGTERAGIAGNTNRGIAVAAGEYIGFLDHDDQLAPDALFEVVRVLQEHAFGLVYSDEDRIEAGYAGRDVHHTPFFKPAYDRDLLLAMNYLCHFVVVRRDVAAGVGGLRGQFDGAQDHDFLLRITEQLAASDICHVARILYHWRVTPGSVSQTPGRVQSIHDTIVAVVQDHLERCGCPAMAEKHADPFGSARAFATRVRWQLPADPPAVSVIIPTRDRLDLLRPCVDSILRTMSRYPGSLEVLVVDNDSSEAATHAYLSTLRHTPHVRVLPFGGPFNWSAINNAAVRAAQGQVLIFLNNDTVVLTPHWCEELAANAVRPDVGAVGARLLYADGTLQHAGVVLGVEGVAGHDSVGESPESGGYFGRSHLQRSASAVTGACLATRRELFERVGGFDEVSLKVAFNDVDYCLRLRHAGYRTVYDPFCVLYHFESKSRGHDVSEAKQARHRFEASAFRTRWGPLVDADPLYNVHFERYSRPFDRLRPPP